MSDLRVVGSVKIWLIGRLRGGKPVIYFLPPAQTTLPVGITLTLVPEWLFSVVYPTAPIKTQLLPGGRRGESVHRDVEARPDGVLLDVKSQAEVSYLTNPVISPSPPTSPPASPYVTSVVINPIEPFDPSTSQLDFIGSVLLPVAEAPAYLDRALKPLDPHVEARPSSITYWLPSLLKHECVGLRFVQHQGYERAAILEVTLVPGVVERLFMLFRGIPRGEALSPRWDVARDQAKADVKFWRGVVGLSEAGVLMRDGSMFRVLEWGGMEVV
ncbi:hypothetical protein DL93DRAFT_2069576 [Clavulina sp. PMI_390]|nr:hypothetical protein DL93DRAFT_2069576 [Clavulina sp. PMI_390]